MTSDEARRRLDEEQARLGEVRSANEAEHLDSESETDGLSELSSLDQHQADHATETLDREKDLSILERVEAELADIEHAMSRLDDGIYGTCEACGGPIGEERLRAAPASRLCLADQERAERQVHAPSDDRRDADS